MPNQHWFGCTPVAGENEKKNRRFNRGLHMEKQTIEQLNARSPKKEHSILVLLLDQAGVFSLNFHKRERTM